ncbi:hypothetical protein ACFRAE_11430 [Sphingobacterium sp. HJSM2_6]|uniref:DUF7935 family protein n=1 Tax=Sphingobacterium sp. HJSM2_6 TaxID=3366264 RepID=UPI003BC8E5AD
MNLEPQLIEFFKSLILLTLAIFAALLLSFRLIWPKIERTMYHMLKFKAATNTSMDHLKHTAYERLLLFTLRLNPQEALMRNYQVQLSVPEFVRVVIADIESEFQYNSTQQLYVSASVYENVLKVKQLTIALLKKQELSPVHTVDSYIDSVLKELSTMDVDIYAGLQQLIKKEANT